MDIFSVITLFGGLAMFLYGMRMMSDSLKENSSGALKQIMERVTNNMFKAFLLGMMVTAIIQSSTATIVITSGLVAAGILTLRQSLGIIIGANVGTTITGQIIRLLDLNSSSTSWLQFFKPSTLAPLALVAGIILIMFCKFRKSDAIGTVVIGFGILFSGLMNMTTAVSVLSDKGVFDNVFSNLSDRPLIGYLAGTGVSFVLQSSSAAVGILQAFSVTGQVLFKGIYSILMGIYLGDCVTTAIVCSIGARPDSRRVGLINILFNLGKSLVVLLGMTIAHRAGLLEQLWNKPVTSGIIANTNSIFNLVSALLLFGFMPLLEKVSRKVIKDEVLPESPYQDKLTALNPQFFDTPAIAFRSCYDALVTMFDAAKANIFRAFDLLTSYDENTRQLIETEENEIDNFADKISSYLVALSQHISTDNQVQILHEYYKMIAEFERMGDHAVNISEAADALRNDSLTFSTAALKELSVLRAILEEVLKVSRQAFSRRDVNAARDIEPLEEVVDDLINTLRENHLERLTSGECSIEVDNIFLNLLGDIERISDVCSNIGLAIIARVNPEIEATEHIYVTHLHQGGDPYFNKAYARAHETYYTMLSDQQTAETASE
ncbi:MAG: Na/Pi cotransporter family protein [Lachnospiraceae bacterium]|nr:Na/Pi cotransporter family protein [Lachnospiraceae bacterium]